MHIRRNGEKDPGHRVDFAFTGDVDAAGIIQMTLNGIEVAMSMREWHAMAVEFERYKQALQRANGFLIMHNLVPVKLEYSPSTVSATQESK